MCSGGDGCHRPVPDLLHGGYHDDEGVDAQRRVISASFLSDVVGLGAIVGGRTCTHAGVLDPPWRRWAMLRERSVQARARARTWTEAHTPACEPRARCWRCQTEVAPGRKVNVHIGWCHRVWLEDVHFHGSTNVRSTRIPNLDVRSTAIRESERCVATTRLVAVSGVFLCGGCAGGMRPAGSSPRWATLSR